MKLDRARKMDSQSAMLSDEITAGEQPDHQGTLLTNAQPNQQDARAVQTPLTANSFRNLMERLKKPVVQSSPKEVFLTPESAPEIILETITPQPPAIENSTAQVQESPTEDGQIVEIATGTEREMSAELTPAAEREFLIKNVAESSFVVSPAASSTNLENALMTEETMSFPLLNELDAPVIQERSEQQSVIEKLESDESLMEEAKANIQAESLSDQELVVADMNYSENLPHPSVIDEVAYQHEQLDAVRTEEDNSQQLAEWQEIEQPQAVASDENVAEGEKLIPIPPAPSLKLVSHDDDEESDIIEISKSIYAVPTFAERSAFLVEIAAQAVIEARKEKSPNPEKLKVLPGENPFAAIALSGLNVSSQDIEKENSGELALSLLDMMLSGPNSGQPQERTLAADALLKIIPHTPLKVMISITNRVALMKTPPPLLLTKLINDPRLEVAGLLLENCNNISDDILTRTIAGGQVALQRLIARRWQVSSAITDQLLTYGDTSVILTLVRNAGAVFSHQGFLRLAQYAREHHQLLAPLVTRSDLQAPIAFELFWFVPTELRRFILSRFLTDSETLTKILKITQVMQGAEQETNTRAPDSRDTDEFLAFLQKGNFQEAAAKLATIANIQLDSALRIVSDKSGEPLAIIMKALNMSRAYFETVINGLKASEFGIIKMERQTAELQSVFDLMSLNKVRVLLTYWDWAVLQTGPYALSH